TSTGVPYPAAYKSATCTAASPYRTCSCACTEGVGVNGNTKNKHTISTTHDGRISCIWLLHNAVTDSPRLGRYEEAITDSKPYGDPEPEVLIASKGVMIPWQVSTDLPGERTGITGRLAAGAPSAACVRPAPRRA